jgi:hypothetical protein
VAAVKRVTLTPNGLPEDAARTRRIHLVIDDALETVTIENDHSDDDFPVDQREFFRAVRELEGAQLVEVDGGHEVHSVVDQALHGFDVVAGGRRLDPLTLQVIGGLSRSFLEDESGAKLNWYLALAACKDRGVTIDYHRPPEPEPNPTTIKLRDPVELRLRLEDAVLTRAVVERSEQVKALHEMLSEHDLLAPPPVDPSGGSL